MTPEEAVGEVLAALDADPRRRGPVAIAVSGGGDSMALLHATAAVARRAVLAVTVDHGLRPEAAEEARLVGRACEALGVPHETLRWDGGGRGNLQERAREARRRLIGAWARGHGAATVFLGHTADDQAETVLLRLARGSGVDGLAGMPASFVAEGVGWDRPLLGLGREVLRVWLRARRIGWVEDPSNEDPRFDRARARAMMDRLGELGLTRERLVRTAGHMARARVSLASEAREAAGRLLQEDGRDLLIPRHLLLAFDQGDTSGRILAAALRWVGGDRCRPRWESLRRLAAVVAAGRAATLAGCRVAPEGGWARVSPEARNPSAPVRAPGERFAESADFG
ncbi:tRNA(Ile)-lysidine synthetase [Rubellimicrobium mesophilum DSM 19309]|uniref:tRNA(Ile)-lysidine synthase n=1 Tax=Rubellimicrobium mesophilum DSM 19309 TaxID=442562 RepID=A0A017HUC4_9RHOB|nr:tRNA lysidine(34) synthetase TilS [Rubellimicrobium mesophilum]EYD77935.1 tRNA(Ile)-lysidine synthetase [Rubellimicrobium mesophilum DSM 19309]